MFVVLFLEQSLISLGTVCGTWRCGHVICISFLFALSGFNCNLGPLIEAQEWQNDDLIVKQSAEYKDYEAWDGLPLEWLESEGYTTNPDEHRPGRVDRGPLSCRRQLGCSDTAYVKEGDRYHDTKGVGDDKTVVSHLLKGV